MASKEEGGVGGFKACRRVILTKYLKSLLEGYALMFVLEANMTSF